MSQISVIVPVYNAEKGIEKCLESIQNQTFKDFEVLLINDGSTDKSVQICMHFCENDSRFKLINQENQGPSAARNKGIDSSDSKYLAFVDSDDYIENNMLECLYTAAENNNADMTICGYRFGNGNHWIEDNCSMYKPGFYKERECYDIAVNMIDVGLPGNIVPYSCVRLVRKECLENPRLRFNTKVKRSEDFLLWVQVAFRINTLCLITDKILYNYVMRGKSVTRCYIENYWEMRKLINEELKNTLPKTEDVSQQLKYLFVRRAYLAMSVASRCDDKKRYKSDLNKILKDKELRLVTKSIPFKSGIKRLKFQYLFLKLRMYPVIKILYGIKHHKLHTKTK